MSKILTGKKAKLLLTDDVRKDICGYDHFWIEGRHIAVSITDAVDHDWDIRGYPPTLRKVIAGLVDHAYTIGLADGRKEVRTNITKALGISSGYHDHSDPRL
jgi:hypothetical protein